MYLLITLVIYSEYYYFHLTGNSLIVLPELLIVYNGARI